MEEWIQLVLFVIFGAVALLTRFLSRRGSQAEPDVVQEEDEITLPPWGNLPMEEEEFPRPDFIEEEAPAPPPAPSPAIQAASKPDPVEEETPAQSPATMPTIMGIPLSPQTFRQGIILAEILRPPKSLREPRQ
jgi:hypothetical protein